MPTPTGYWTEGKIVNGTNVGGGVFVQGTPPPEYTAKVNATLGTPAIVSSSSVTDSNNRTTAMTGAGAAASPSYTPPQQPDPLQTWMQNLNSNINQELDTAKTTGQQAQQALQVSFDAQLASQNQMYGSAIQQIRQQAENARQVATSNAVSLNPYSQAKGAQTSVNFTNAVNAKYQQLETDIRQKAVAAEQLARAGYAKESLQIQQNINKSISDARSQVNQALYQYASLAQNQSQFNISQGNVMERAAQDDFQTYLNTFSGSPQLQTDIDAYMATGKISAGLAPILQKGMQAGYAPTEALSIFQYQTDKVRQQQELEDYRTNQLVNASDRQTVAQMKVASLNAITQAGALLSAQGVQPGTIEYARGVAQATGQSPVVLGATESSTYATIANIGQQLVGLKSTLDGITKEDDIKNLLLSKTGTRVQSLTAPQLALLTAKINAIAAPVARVMFGERGVLTEPDITRTLSTLPTGASTSEVRDALYKQILINAKTGAINKLSVDASAGKNVAGMTPYIDKMVGDIDSVLGQLSKPTTSGRSYTDPTTGRTYTY